MDGFESRLALLQKEKDTRRGILQTVDKVRGIAPDFSCDKSLQTRINTGFLSVFMV